MSKSIWARRLLKASFKGVPFFVVSSDFGAGRRVKQHEFPDRDESFAEDLGKKADTFQIEGHVLGDNYFQNRDALISACSNEGVGELVHPYLGNKQVICGPISVKETTDNGRIATISFTFFDAGNNAFPSIEIDKDAALIKSADLVIINSAVDFEDKFDIIGLPSFAIDSARTLVQQAADKFEESTKIIADVSDEIADVAFGIRSLRADINSLLSAPGKLAERLQNSINLLSSVAINKKDALRITSALLTFGDDVAPIEPTTPTRESESQNNTAIVNLIRRTTIAESAKIAIEVDFSSVEEATEQREILVSELNTQLDDVSADTGEFIDTLFQSLIDVKASIIETVPDVDLDLPSIVEFTPLATTPSLVIVYDLFEIPDGEDDLILRNNIAHPGFISGGVALEVLSG